MHSWVNLSVFPKPRSRIAGEDEAECEALQDIFDDDCNTSPRVSSIIFTGLFQAKWQADDEPDDG